MAEFPAKLIWAPTIIFHDPDPPFAPEEPGVSETLFEVDGEAAAAFLGDSIATTEFGAEGVAESSFLSNILETEFDAEGVSVASFVSGVTISAEFAAQGVGTASFLGEGVAETSFDVEGVATAGFIGARRRVARCEGAFEFMPLAVPVWAGTLRRAPMIQVRDMINDSPNSSTFTDTEEPSLGQDVQMDVEGTGRLMGGAVQSYETRGDGDCRESWAYDTVIADYLWLLNERRPFICFEDVPADEAITQLFNQYAPSDFTLEVEAGMPNVTVKFVGEQTFTECVSIICARVNAHFKCDYDKVFQVRKTEGITENPADVDDDNDDLLWDPPPVLKVDASQIRNRVFVKGAFAKLLADAAPGATTLEVDGIDVFNEDGGEAVVGCQRITYEGVLKTFIYPTPEESPQVPGAPEAISHLAKEGELTVGPIRTNVRYSTTMVIAGKESERSGTDQVTLTPMQIIGSMGLTDFDNDGFVPSGAHTWAIVAKALDGSAWHNDNTWSTGVFAQGRFTFPFAISALANDFRPGSIVLYRFATIDGVPDFYETYSTPFVGNGTYNMIDGKSDASLGNARPKSTGHTSFHLHNTVGERVYLVGSSLPLITAFEQGASQVRVYREENYNGGASWTEPQVCMTLVPTDNPDPYYEDTRSTSALLYDLGEDHNDLGAPAPPPAPPKIRLILYGVSGLTETAHEGDEVSIFVERNDLTAQVFWAQQRGGNGIREFTIVDRNLRSDAELIVRGDAELTLFAMPIKTVTYATRDDRSVSGTFVNFNLTEPPIVASLRIQESTVDQIHEAASLVQRYTCVASTVKFTLEDLLRRAQIREQ